MREQPVKLRAPSHSTVVAYLALFVAIGGSAYAVSKIGSKEIENRSIRGKDVANDTITGRQVDELRLGGPAAVGDEPSGSCDPPAGATLDCVGRTITLRAESALLVIATGSKSSDAGAGVCAMAVDGSGLNARFLGGTAADGFALTKVTPSLDTGPHNVVLRCTESAPNLKIDNPTIAVVAVNAVP
jgi:hypothetical protein